MSVRLDDDLLAVRARLGWDDRAEPRQCCAVAGYDGSVSSLAALAYASGWARRNLGSVVVVHVDAADAMMMAEYACGVTGLVAPEIAPPDLSADVANAMAQTPIRWTYLNVRGDVADQLEHVAAALAADVIIVGKSRRPRVRRTSSVARRLLRTTRHIVVVV